MRFALRVLAAIIGIVGAVVALIVNFFFSLGTDTFRVLGLTTSQSHGLIGLLLVVVALLGSLIVVGWPVTGAVLLLIAAVGFMVIVHWWAFVASPLLLLAALMGYLDRKKEQPKTA